MMFDDLEAQTPHRPERDLQFVQLSLDAPLRSTAPQHDHGHLPLFVAANEPDFLSLI